jgi:hypothetical protein
MLLIGSYSKRSAQRGWYDLLLNHGAQGRDRTTDTRIFSPVTMIDFIRILSILFHFCNVAARALSALAHELQLCRVDLGRIVTTRKEVAVSVIGHRDRGMAEPLLSE